MPRRPKIDYTGLTALATTCPCLASRRVARALTQHFDQAMRPLGLTMNQAGLLAVIAVREPVTIADLATATGTDRTTLTRTLRGLTSRGSVTVAPGSNRRYREVTTTRRGQRLAATVLHSWRRAVHDLEALVEPEATEALVQTADRVSGRIPH